MKKYISIVIFSLILLLGMHHVVSAQTNPVWGGGKPTTNTTVPYKNTVTSGNTSSGTVTSGNTNNGTVTSGNTNNGTVTSGNTSSGTVTTGDKLEDPLGEGISLEGLLLKLFDIVLYIGVPLVAFFLIWSGFMFVSAQGNPEKIETAKSRLVWTIIGAILLLGAWTISQAIKGTIGDIKNGATSFLETHHLS